MMFLNRLVSISVVFAGTNAANVRLLRVGSTTSNRDNSSASRFGRSLVSREDQKQLRELMMTHRLLDMSMSMSYSSSGSSGSSSSSSSVDDASSGGSGTTPSVFIPGTPSFVIPGAPTSSPVQNITIEMSSVPSLSPSVATTPTDLSGAVVSQAPFVEASATPTLEPTVTQGPTTEGLAVTVSDSTSRGTSSRVSQAGKVSMLVILAVASVALAGVVISKKMKSSSEENAVESPEAPGAPLMP